MPGRWTLVARAARLQRVSNTAVIVPVGCHRQSKDADSRTGSHRYGWVPNDHILADRRTGVVKQPRLCPVDAPAQVGRRQFGVTCAGRARPFAMV